VNLFFGDGRGGRPSRPLLFTPTTERSLNG
jgi:hypothetical protein